MSKWQPLFYAFPIETMIRRYKKGYYQAIADSQIIPIDYRPFIEYTLNIIEQSLQDILKNGGLNGGLNLLQQEIISLIRDNRYDCPDVVHISNVLSWALPKPTYFFVLTQKSKQKRSRLDAPSRPAACARSLNVENSPSAQTVRRFSSLTSHKRVCVSARRPICLCGAQNGMRGGNKKRGRTYKFAPNLLRTDGRKS